MARASAIHVITTDDPNLYPVVAVATVKHELVTALGRLVEAGEDLESKPWHYMRLPDIGALAPWDQFVVPDPAGALSAYAFWAKETAS